MITRKHSIVDLEQIIKTELAYYSCFSQGHQERGCIRYTDTKLLDMYDHNFYYFENGSDLRIAADLAAAEYERLQYAGKGHVKILFEPGWEPDLDDPAFTPFSRETYLFMGIDTVDYTLLSDREDGIVKVLTSKQEGEEVFQLEQQLYREHADDFGSRRARRKLEVYNEKDKPIELYLCYHAERLIGDCELFLPGTGAGKIEDFDIHPDFQGKGFGTTVLRRLLEKSRETGHSFAYLVADKKETAQHMYTKCHFSVLCEQTCLFYLVNKGVN